MKKFYAFLATMLVAMFSFSSMAEDPYVFVGAWNGWDISGAPEFVQQADGTYKIEKIEKIAGAFKVVKGHDWTKPAYGSNGSTINLGTEYAMKLGGGDVSFSNSISSYANCSLTLRVDGGNLYLTINGAEASVEVGVWCLCGAFNGWSTADAPEFTKTAEGIYEITIPEMSGEFGIIADHSWNICFKKNSSGGDIELNVPYQLGSGDNLRFADSELVYINCKFVLNTTGSTATLTATVDDVMVPETSYQLVGEYNGWNIGSGDMTMVSEGLYEISLDSFAGEFKITKNHSWNDALCTNGSAVVLNEPYYPSISSYDNNNIVIGDGSEIKNFYLTLDVTDEQNPVIIAMDNSGAELVEINSVAVSAQGGVISVAGAEGAAVYTAGGALVGTGNSTSVAPGLYIVKVGDMVRKVVVK